MIPDLDIRKNPRERWLPVGLIWWRGGGSPLVAGISAAGTATGASSGRDGVPPVAVSAAPGVSPGEAADAAAGTGTVTLAASGAPSADRGADT
jgi:hypothetical protein